MTIEEAIAQLKDLRKDMESFEKINEPDSVFAHDIEAIDIVVKTLEENAELKRLLRLAMEDMKNVSDDNCCYHCIYGDPITRHCQEYKGNGNCYKWQHADEAMKLIGGDENV